MTGTFITFEGPEGSGKSTQVKLLVERLEAESKKVVCTREPGGTATGEAIRNILQHDSVGEQLGEHAELLLFTASRAQLMNQVILPSLEKGEWVICVRFFYSTLAYQGFARDLKIETLDLINDFAIYGRKPDLTILLDLDIEHGFERVEERYSDGKGATDRFEREARDFHQRVRDGYHQLAQREPARFRTIDAGRSVEVVASDVWSAVREAVL